MIKTAQIMAFVNYKGGVSTTTTRMGYLIVVWAVKNHTRAKTRGAIHKMVNEFKKYITVNIKN